MSPFEYYRQGLSNQLDSLRAEFLAIRHGSDVALSVVITAKIRAIEAAIREMDRRYADMKSYHDDMNDAARGDNLTDDNGIVQ